MLRKMYIENILEIRKIFANVLLNSYIIEYKNIMS